MDERLASVKGVIFDIQRFTLHDGPGIRTLVFLKGCPLRCPWCANPESVHQETELGFIRTRCNKCGECVPACPEHAVTVAETGMPRIDRGKCTNCGACTTVCLPKSLIIYGREATVAEVLQEVRRDKLFYGDTGGVTVSGGEPLLQPTFVKALFEASHQEGIGTCLETCGFARTEVLKDILSVTDYVLFDLKHLNSAKHQKYTGVPNEPVLANAKAVVESGVPALFRTPVIPGVNDSPENVRETAKFIKTLQGENAAIELMLYHRLGVAKYEALDRNYTLMKLESLLPDAEKVKSIQRAYEETGVRCSVSI